MKLINKLTGRESTQPQNMTLRQKVDIDKICRNLKQLLDSADTKQKKALRDDDKQNDIQRNIYCFYIEFATTTLEDEFLLIETSTERTLFLEANKDNYTETRDLHPNVKLAYIEPEEHDQIIDYVIKLEASVEAKKNLPSDFFNAIDRMDAI